MSTTVSTEARTVVATLLGLPCEDRNEFIRTLDPVETGELLAAVHYELGTPFGLWFDDPVGFVELALGETLWSRQKDVCRSVVDHERTAVPSCHGAGKSHLAARLVAWWILTRAPGTAVAITTGDKWSKVRNQLWLPHIVTLQKRHKLPGRTNQVEWFLGDHVAAWGMSPADYDEAAFSGIHHPFVLVIVDEAGRLSPALGQSLESFMVAGGGSNALLGQARLLAIGNPPVDETGSPWFEQRCESIHWSMLRIAATDTPNFTNETTELCRVHPLMPPHAIAEHLPTPQSVQIVADDEGEDSAYYIARILAQFAHDVADKAIPRSWLEDACDNDDVEASTWVRLGVDVAADGGDEFAIARADGLTVRMVHNRRMPQGVTTFDLAGIVLEQIEAAEVVARRLESDRPVRVKVDRLGLGMGVFDTLRAWKTEGRHNAEIVGVAVSERPTTKKGQDRYANQRAEMWWTGRQLVQPRKDPDTGELGGTCAIRLDVEKAGREVRQLSAPKYGRNSSGKILIESKDDMRRRGVQSPDRAEAILLAVYEPGASAPARIATPGRGRRL